MKQTAVEFFAEELNKWRTKEFGEEAMIGIPIEVLEEANKLFEQQIIEANENQCIDENGDFMTGKQYYNETYRSI